MKKSISIISPYTLDSIDLIKICFLYFDNIELVQRTLLQVSPVDKKKEVMKPGDIGIITGVTPFLRDDILEKIKPLLRARVVSILDESDVQKTLGNDKSELINRIISNLISQRGNFIIEWADTKRSEDGRLISSKIKFADKEVIKIHERFVGKIGIGQKIDFEFIYEFYGGLLNDILNFMLSDKIVYTDSSVLNNFIQFAYDSELTRGQKMELGKTENLNPRISTDLIKMNFLNVANFDFEEIFEIKERLKDNLESYRKEIGTISYEAISGIDKAEIYDYLDEAIRYRIQPKIEELEKQIKLSPNKLLIQLKKSLKNPATYVPVLGSLFHQIPAQIALYLSLGIMSLESAIDYLKERKSLEKNGLMYVVKLRKCSKKGNTSHNSR